MNWKTTLLLLVAAIGIGTYISLYEIRQPSPERREKLARQVVSIPAEMVTEIAIEAPEATVTLAREGVVWRLTDAGSRASDTIVSDLLAETASLIAERILSGSEGEPLDPAAYGLDPAVGRLTLVTDEGSTTLLVGETTPVREDRYAQLADQPEIFIIPPRLFNMMNQSADAFRDPRLIRFSTLGVEALAVTSNKGSVSLDQRDGTWHITEPVDDLAERFEVNTLLSRLSRMEIQQHLEGTLTEEPQAEVTLTYGEPPTTTTLRFGTALPDDETLVHAARSDEAELLYVVLAEDVEALLKEPSSLRAQSCFDFFTSQVRQVDLAWEDAGWTIQQVNGAWRAPEAELELDTTQVQVFLNKLGDLRVGKFVETKEEVDLERVGLAEPSGTIAVWSADDDEPQRLLIGSQSTTSGDHYGLIERRQALIELPDHVKELLTTTLEDLRPFEMGPLTPLTDSTPSEDQEEAT